MTGPGDLSALGGAQSGNYLVFDVDYVGLSSKLKKRRFERLRDD